MKREHFQMLYVPRVCKLATGFGNSVDFLHLDRGLREPKPACPRSGDSAAPLPPEMPTSSEIAPSAVPLAAQVLDLARAQAVE